MTTHADNQSGKQEIFRNVNSNGDITVGNITQNIQYRSSLLKPIAISQNIPHSSAAQFVGRVHELETLHQRLQQTDGLTISVLAGMGGVGKTELAIQYAKKYAEFYPGGVCWLRARTSSLVDQIFNFTQIHLGFAVPQELWGKSLNLNQQLDWCWQHWRPQGLVLVILDDVIDLASCREILPPASRYRVLITTRQRGLGGSFSELFLDVLSLEASLELLVTFIGKSRVEREHRTTECLCECLGHLPLALELVGRFLAEDPDLTIAEISMRLKTQSLKDLAIDLKDQQMQQHNCVRAAFELSWQELEAPISNVAQLLSLFALNVIHWELVKSTAQRLNWTIQTLNEAKKQLYKCFLIQRVGEGCYKIHPLIREFLQIKLAESGMTNDLRQAFAVSMAAVAQQIPELPTPQQIQTTTLVIPHLADAAKLITECLWDEDFDQLFVGLARFYEGQGLYKLAEPWREQCLLIVKTHLGSEHSKVAESLNALAMLYRYQGRYSEAEPLFMQALELRKNLLGDEHINVAESLHNLAVLYRLQGRYSEAESLFKHALELRKYFLGDKHLAVAETLCELGSLLLIKDNLNWNHRLLIFLGLPVHLKAELLLEPLERQRHLLDGDHIIMVRVLNFLGVLYIIKRRYHEAKLLFEQSLEMGKRLVGDAHPLTIHILSNLALVCFYQRCYHRAELLYMQALEVQQKSDVNDHPMIAHYLNSLGFFYRNVGHYRKAESFFLRAKKHAEQTLGANHPITISYRKTSNSFILKAIFEALSSIPLITSSFAITSKIIIGKALFFNIYFLFIYIMILIVKADIGYTLLGLTYITINWFYFFFFLLVAFQLRRTRIRGGLLHGMRFMLIKTWLMLSRLWRAS